MLNHHNIPYNHINICLVGCVSSGKSTLLNSIFCEDYAQCKIKRTTMVPCVFVESNESSTDSQTKINNEIIKINNEIILSQENGHEAPEHKLNRELVFNVEKLDIKISDQILITVYDIPGLNDARTKKTYYKYLEDNFHKFNIIIFIDDIQSGLNTSDEIEIVHFIKDNITRIKKEENKDVYLLVVANKADDMQLSGDDDTPDDQRILEINPESELKEMFDQIKKTVNRIFKKTDNLIGYVPLCARDAHLYRMIRKHGSEYTKQLNSDTKLKIGINELGKKFSKMTKKKQDEELATIFENKSSIEDMIRLSGFSGLEKILKKHILTNGISNIMDNLYYEYKRLPDISVNNLIENLTAHLNILEVMKHYEESEYKDNMETITATINSEIEYTIKNKSDIIEIIVYYDEIMRTLKKDIYCGPIMGKFIDYTTYPKYLYDKVYSLIIDEYSNHTIKLESLSYFKLIQTIGYSSKEVFEEMITAIINNYKGINTFVLENLEEHNLDFMIEIFDLISNASNFKQFIKFLLVNIIEYDINYNNIIRSILYRMYNEYQLSVYLNSSIKVTHNLELFITDFDKENMYSNIFKIDKYYLEHCL